MQPIAVSVAQLVGEAFPPYVTDDLVSDVRKVVTLESACRQAGRCTLKLDRLSIEEPRLNIRDVNLEVSAGEVIGLAGMEGSGQRQFLRTVSGLMRPVGGKILLDGADLTGKPYRNFINAGISYVPAARLEEGLIPGLTLAEHFALLDKSQGFFVTR